MAPFFALLLSSAKSIWPFIKNNWRQLAFGGMLLWCIICFLSHCAGGLIPGIGTRNNSSDTIVEIDTSWQYGDTSKVHVLEGFNTTPTEIRLLNDSIRKLLARDRPKAPNFDLSADCRDSLAALWGYSKLLNRSLERRDSTLFDALATRSYADSLRNDSIVVYAAFDVVGKLSGTPRFSYRYLAPYPVITKEIAITKASRSKIYLEGGIGPRLLWKDNELTALVGSAGLGYTTKKNWSFGAAGDFSHEDYTVKAVVRKSFDIGK